jgi:hypothetical protein
MSAPWSSDGYYSEGKIQFLQASVHVIAANLNDLAVISSHPPDRNVIPARKVAPLVLKGLFWIVHGTRKDDLPDRRGPLSGPALDRGRGWRPESLTEKARSHNDLVGPCWKLLFQNASQFFRRHLAVCDRRRMHVGKQRLQQDKRHQGCGFGIPDKKQGADRNQDGNNHQEDAGDPVAQAPLHDPRSISRNRGRLTSAGHSRPLAKG